MFSGGDARWRTESRRVHVVRYRARAPRARTESHSDPATPRAGGWIDVERFGNQAAAAKALDDAIAAGAQPDDLRLTAVPPSRARLVLAVVGIVVLVIVAVAALSMVIFAS
jgi:hypothetical protein